MANPNLIRRARAYVASLIAPNPINPATGQLGPLQTRASGGYPYDAGAAGRRAQGWVTSRLGPTTLLWGNLDQIRSRARDEIRNNPWAGTAANNFESQVIGNGIRPRWNIANESLKVKVEAEFARWVKTCDSAGLQSFYGLQALAVREIFAAGEVLVRFHPRPSSWKLRIPLQLQLIEGEQLPVFRNVAPTEGGVDRMPPGNMIRTGIEFDPSGRRVAYHMYKEHPGETMFFPLEGLTFMRVSADDMLHVYKPVRAGQLRGEPHLTSVLSLLYELEQYTDAELVRKKVVSMFAGFIKKVSPDGDIIPIDPNNAVTGTAAPGQPNTQDPGVANVKIEPGTLQELLPGEDITFPQLPADSSYEQFLRVCLHKFSSGVGATYEQITSDLRGVTYSSIRAGLLDFRRKCEQFQLGVVVHQFCQPVAQRWLREAQIAGVIELPGYVDDPGQYEDITWTTPGWDWVDPQKDVAAAIAAIRAGLDTRSNEIASRGLDPFSVDTEQASDYARADRLGLVHDSDPRKILVGRESNPEAPEVGEPDDQADAKAKSGESGGNGGDSGGGIGAGSSGQKR